MKMLANWIEWILQEKRYGQWGDVEKFDNPEAAAISLQSRTLNFEGWRVIQRETVEKLASPEILA